jgi:NDP-sugar pyrophosphorylase family protein
MERKKGIMDISIAVVPVAGLGTRLLPATKSQPKEMLPVGRKPVVQYVVDELSPGRDEARVCSSPVPARPPWKTILT